MHKIRIYPKKLLWRLYIVCLILSVILGFYGLYTHLFHYHFSFQYLPQFFALFGILGCILIILIAKGIGRIIVVDEDYYDKK